MATRTANNGAAGNFSAGSAWVGGVAPTAADDAVIPVGTTSITIDAGSVCRSLTCTAFTGTMTHTAGVTLTIGDGTAGAGNVALAFGTFTYTLGDVATSAINFVSTDNSVTQTVNFNGKTTGNVTYNSTSGNNAKWQLTAGHVCGATATVTFNRGTLDTNGQTCSWGLFSAGSLTKTLTMGSSAITITGAGQSFVIGTLTTVTANTAVITMTASGSFPNCVATGGETIVLTGTSNQIDGTTYTNVTRTGTAAKTDVFTIRASISVAGTFTVTGQSSINRIIMSSSTVGTARTITAATVVCSNTDFQDIIGAGAGSWDFSARTDIGDCGGNSGITFPASVAQTWSGTSGGNWSTNAWTTRVPLPQDDVSLGVAFSASQTVTADMPRLGRSISWTGATGTPAFGSSTNTSFYGSLTLISGMTVPASNLMQPSGRSTYTITSAGQTLPQITLLCPGGTYTLQDALTSSNIITITNGTLNTNSFNTSSGRFTCNSSATTGLTLGTTTITTTATNTGNLVDFGGSGLTVSGASSTITITGSTANTRTMALGGKTLGTLNYTLSGSTGELDITGSNSFAQINFSDVTNARSLKFTAGTTTTIRNGNGFNVQGTAGKLMTVSSITGATHTLASTSRQVCSYLNVSYSIASAGLFYAQTTSTDGGNNTGWIFTNAPIISVGGGSNGIQNRMNLQNLRSLV